ncbi:MAG: DUF2283 domain-containing protein [Chloroflexi bacterium]|nr:DUF2283 domain-containing protein [Chloroflexota bacterium]
MRVEHDPEADAVYVYLTDDTETPVAETRELDDARMIDYAADGTVVGVEFLGVSEGVLLDGVPQADEIAAALHSIGIATSQPVP